MDLRKLILATLLAMVVMGALAALWHGWVLHDFYVAHSPLRRETLLLRLMGLGYFVLAVMMAVMYPKGYEGGTPWSEGLRFGAFMGVLFTLPRGLVLYGAEGCHTGTLLVVDAAWHLVEQGAGGLVIALVHGGTGRGVDDDGA